jgi:uroporphyrin-III C-methyltransferase / precorrin-2 dehydrogenase / sirohydrochlorin ferrochelatase
MPDPASAGRLRSAPAERLPLFLDLTGRRAVVVGGGAVALRRARALADAGARLRVVAPDVLPELAELAEEVLPRRYAAGDLQDAWLVQAATDSTAVNAAVAADAEGLRIWCVRADAATVSAAWTPAVARSGDLTVAVSAGGDPRRAARLGAAISAALDAGTLPLRPDRPASTGRVALVGGGPGDAGLITVRGRRRLAEADVVVIDRLAPRELLAALDPDVEIVEAGKAPGCHDLSQQLINDVLVARAREGNRVVRLKGGDPFVFGRGGEEALACIRAGVPFEVVPGVTSAFAVPAYAGIPVTARGVAQDVAVVSAHGEPGENTVDWDALATTRGTVVLMMAMARLEQLTKELIARGRPADTPAAVIASGTMPDELVVVGTLVDIAARAAHAGAGNPAVVVVGDVVRLREQLAWR